MDGGVELVGTSVPLVNFLETAIPLSWEPLFHWGFVGNVAPLANMQEPLFPQ